MKNHRIYSSLVAGSILIASGLPLFAAKFPGSFFKTFVFKGDAAVQAKDFLGLGTGVQKTSYPLSENMRHAKEISTDPKMANGSEDNSVTYRADQGPELLWEGVFLDRETGSMKQGPRFYVESPIYREGTIPDNGWGLLVKKTSSQWQAPEPRKWGRSLYEKRLALADRSTLTVTIFQLIDYTDNKEVWSYKIVLGVDP